MGSHLPLTMILRKDALQRPVIQMGQSSCLVCEMEP